jgi:hypothetical protein
MRQLLDKLIRHLPQARLRITSGLPTNRELSFNKPDVHTNSLVLDEAAVNSAMSGSARAPNRVAWEYETQAC